MHYTERLILGLVSESKTCLQNNRTDYAWPSPPLNRHYLLQKNENSSEKAPFLAQLPKGASNYYVTLIW